MIDYSKFLSKNFDTPSAKATDWILSAAVFIYGLYSSSWILIAIGILGFFASWYRPVSRFQKFLKGTVKRRS